jgi:hypothetical protein
MNKYIKISTDIASIINKYLLPLKERINKKRKRCLNELVENTSVLKFCIDEEKYEKIYEQGWNHKYYDIWNTRKWFPFKIRNGKRFWAIR